MNIKFIKLLVFGLATNLSSQSQSNIPGLWKGTSICQIKSSPCHDEIAAYQASKIEGTNKFSFIMNKVVNGKEENMGTTIFTFDSTKSMLISRDNERDATWEFHVKGNTIDGKLIYRGEIYRIISLKKED
ncbi:MAG: hypothetical protein C5B52_06545 [Bacteroidetes bacterium]|nr:MAG: hypothetical protein C5B52_06545 [Bacteroidota bacterium]